MNFPLQIYLLQDCFQRNQRSRQLLEAMQVEDPSFRQGFRDFNVMISH